MEVWMHAEGPDAERFLSLPDEVARTRRQMIEMGRTLMATIEEFRDSQLALIENVKGDLDNIKAQLAEALAGQGVAREEGIQAALTGLQAVSDRLSAVDAETPPVEPPVEPTP